MVKDKDIALKAPLAANLGIELRVIPNPVTGKSAKASYYLQKNGKVAIRIVDLTGRLLRSINVGYQKPGTYTYYLEELWKLTSGYYTIVLEQSNEVIARKQFMINN